MPSATAKVDSVKEFVFTYSSAAGRPCELRTSICLASCGSAAEISHRLMLLHKLPCYLQQSTAVIVNVNWWHYLINRIKGINTPRVVLFSSRDMNLREFMALYKFYFDFLIFWTDAATQTVVLSSPTYDYPSLVSLNSPAIGHWGTSPLLDFQL